MARVFGEDFKQPVDYFTGKPISGAPLMGRPTTSRPNGNGIIQLAPQDGNKTAAPADPKKSTVTGMFENQDPYYG